MTAADITVVIPTRNRCWWLRRGLDSALSQVGVTVEVIVVDDGSTDATATVLRAERDPRVRVLRHERSRGVAAARNHGIAEARTDWIAFLDDDDFWAPEKLRLQLDAAHREQAEFAYAGAAHVAADLTVIGVEAAPKPESLAVRLRSINALPAGSSNLIARRRSLIELGGFDEDLHHLADWDLWLRLSRVGRGAACDDILVAYVKHPDNMLALSARRFFSELEQFAAKHSEPGRDKALAPDRVAVARWVAMSHRRAGRRRIAAGAYLHAARFGAAGGNIASALRAISETRAAAERWPPRPETDPAWLTSFRNGTGADRGSKLGR